MKVNRFVLVFGVAALCFLLDQISKDKIMGILPLNGLIEIIPGFFNLVYVENRGAAFGFLSSQGGGQFWFFLAVTVLAFVLIIMMTRKAAYNFMAFAGFGLILGGAVGNLADRVRFRAVIDFLDFYIYSWHWPAFNVADVGICAGAALVGVSVWRLAREEKRGKHASD